MNALVRMSPMMRNRSLINHTFDRFFDQAFNSGLSRVFNDQYHSVPAVNIIEGEKEFKIELAIPGMAKEDIHIQVNDGVLTIKADKQIEKSETEKTLRKEFGYVKFSRSFTLPELINVEAIEAKFENGILGLHLPKAVEVKPEPKRIEIG